MKSSDGYIFASDRFAHPYQKFIDTCAANKNLQVTGIGGGHHPQRMPS
jgi:hypothetical protein